MIRGTPLVRCKIFDCRKETITCKQNCVPTFCNIASAIAWHWYNNLYNMYISACRGQHWTKQILWICVVMQCLPYNPSKFLSRDNEKNSHRCTFCIKRQDDCLKTSTFASNGFGEACYLQLDIYNRKDWRRFTIFFTYFHHIN